MCHSQGPSCVEDQDFLLRILFIWVMSGAGINLQHDLWLCFSMLDTSSCCNVHNIRRTIVMLSIRLHNIYSNIILHAKFSDKNEVTAQFTYMLCTIIVLISLAGRRIVYVSTV